MYCVVVFVVAENMGHVPVFFGFSINVSSFHDYVCLGAATSGKITDALAVN